MGHMPQSLHANIKTMEKEQQPIKDYLKEEVIRELHNNEENALVVSDYPYGFRLRTKIRYSIETTKRGDRFISQTLNPKTNLWNKPKKSVYSDMIVLIRKDNGHIAYLNWSVQYSEIEELERFLEKIGDFPLNDLQKDKIKIGRAVYKTRQHISYSAIETTNETEEETKEREEKQNQVNQELNKIFSYYRREQEKGLIK